MAQFVQCTLQKGERICERWIPKEMAKVGKFAKFKINGEWTHDWEIKMLGAVKEIDVELPRKSSFWNRFVGLFNK